MSSKKSVIGLLLGGTLVAAAIVAGGFRFASQPTGFAGDAEPAAATAAYGEQLLRDTAAYLGPNHDDPNMRYSGTNLACASCHLDIGTRPGYIVFVAGGQQVPKAVGARRPCWRLARPNQRLHAAQHEWQSAAA